eukprot:6688185-Karenia_brevis.AAC.1
MQEDRDRSRTISAGSGECASPSKVARTGSGERASSSNAPAMAADDDMFIGFCAYEEAEVERPKVDWQQDERKCLTEFGFGSDCHSEVLQMLMQLGDQVHVSEVFCSTRDTAKVNRFGLSAGIAMDVR